MVRGLCMARKSKKYSYRFLKLKKIACIHTCRTVIIQSLTFIKKPGLSQVHIKYTYNILFIKAGTPI